MLKDLSISLKVYLTGSAKSVSGRKNLFMNKTKNRNSDILILVLKNAL